MVPVFLGVCYVCNFDELAHGEVVVCGLRISWPSDVVDWHSADDLVVFFGLPPDEFENVVGCARCARVSRITVE